MRALYIHPAKQVYALDHQLKNLASFMTHISRSIIFFAQVTMMYKGFETKTKNIKSELPEEKQEVMAGEPLEDRIQV